MTVDPTADRAVFRQLADVLRDQIGTGDLPAGSVLPSEATLCQMHGVSRVSVRRAVALLRAEGLVVTVPGRGSFVRQTQAVNVETVLAGSTVAARPATEAERRSLALPEGWPVLVITSADGDERVLPADRHILRFDA